MGDRTENRGLTSASVVDQWRQLQTAVQTVTPLFKLTIYQKLQNFACIFMLFKNLRFWTKIFKSEGGKSSQVMKFSSCSLYFANWHCSLAVSAPEVNMVNTDHRQLALFSFKPFHAQTQTDWTGMKGLFTQPSSMLQETNPFILSRALRGWSCRRDTWTGDFKSMFAHGTADWWQKRTGKGCKFFDTTGCSPEQRQKFVRDFVSQTSRLALKSCWMRSQTEAPP